MTNICLPNPLRLVERGYGPLQISNTQIGFAKLRHHVGVADPKALIIPKSLFQNVVRLFGVVEDLTERFDLHALDLT